MSCSKMQIIDCIANWTLSIYHARMNLFFKFPTPPTASEFCKPQQTSSHFFCLLGGKKRKLEELDQDQPRVQLRGLHGSPKS